MNVLGSAAIVRSTDGVAAVRRYQALFGMRPLHEFPIVDRQLNVAVFPGLSVLSGEPSALAPLADLRATVFVGSLPETNAELRQTGWTTEGSLGPGASLLARDPDGNLIEFVENPGPVSTAADHRRVAVVTGGAGAIGGAIVRSLEASGHRTVVIDRDGTIPCDLGSEPSTRAAAAAVLEHYGRCDVFVQSAAAFDQVALGELDSATWRHVIAVNVESALWLAQSFAPGMAERGFGRIIFVISWLDRTIAAVRIAARAVRRIPAS